MMVSFQAEKDVLWTVAIPSKQTVQEGMLQEGHLHLRWVHLVIKNRQHLWRTYGNLFFQQPYKGRVINPSLPIRKLE